MHCVVNSGVGLREHSNGSSGSINDEFLTLKRLIAFQGRVHPENET
jgi:hypothetical protein